jgi:acyl-CoA thioester hydrolase
MTTHPNENDFSLSITVLRNDIDELGHVNNVVYVRWVQEVAAAHWNSLPSAEIRQKYLWVVVRHEIDYVRAAFEGDHLIATTWVGESNGARSERIVHIIHAKTGNLIAKAKTMWCMLDGVTMKPKRVDEEVNNLLKS